MNDHPVAPSALVFIEYDERQAVRFFDAETGK
jgi:hypothetical protein